LGPIILSAFPDALFHQPLHLPRQGQFIPLLPYGSPLHVLLNNQPRYHEYAEDDTIHLRPSYLFVRTIIQMARYNLTNINNVCYFSFLE
jgi:hypothetical protein